MDREVKRLKQSHIPVVKERWNSRRGPEFTWEREDQMQKKYLHLFPIPASVANATSVSHPFPIRRALSSKLTIKAYDVAFATDAGIGKRCGYFFCI
ncbi:hypothetical protein Tco_1295133 [Tanacetum coccineum]